jgi:hypothetical protein
MTLKQENSIILGIFTALFVILVSISIFAIPLKSKLGFSAPPQIGAMQAMPGIDEKKGVNARPPGFQPSEQTSLQLWGRDPFASSWLNESSPAATATAAMSEEGLTVTLILMSETKKIVAINHKIYREGDMVRDEKIVTIKRDGVVLEKNGTQRLLPLPKSVVNF